MDLTGTKFNFPPLFCFSFLSTSYFYLLLPLSLLFLFFSSPSLSPPQQSFVIPYFALARSSLLSGSQKVNLTSVSTSITSIVKMRFNSALALSSLLVLAVAQDTNSTSTASAATATASLSAQAKCAESCTYTSLRESSPLYLQLP